MRRSSDCAAEAIRLWFSAARFRSSSASRHGDRAPWLQGARAVAASLCRGVFYKLARTNNIPPTLLDDRDAFGCCAPSVKIAQSARHRADLSASNSVVVDE